MKQFSFFFLLFQACLLHADSIHLLYFTDAHQIYPVDDVEGGRGGVARLKTIADNARRNNPETLLIHGGDLCGGVLFGGIYKGYPMIEAFNQIPLDLSNFGQHEFDFGLAHARDLVQKSDFQWITTNLTDANGDNFASLPRFVIREIKGQRVGFIGLTDAMHTTWTREEIVQEDLFEAISNILTKIEDVDILIALTQTDFQTNRKLLQKFDAIDVILTEEQYEYASNVFWEGNRPIIATAGNMSSVASIKIGENQKTSVSIMPLDSTVEADPDFLKTEQFYIDEINKKLSEKVAVLNVHLNFRDSYKGESLIANLVTDAFREWHHSDVGLINSGSIRNSHPEGEMTMKSIRTLLPYGNKVCKISMSGKALKQLLEERADKTDSQLLHVSGIQYEYSAPKNLLKVLRHNKEVQDEDMITVSTSDYLLSKITVPFEIIIGPNDKNAPEDYNVLKVYCQKRAEIEPVIEGRIVRELN